MTALDFDKVLGLKLKEVELSPIPQEVTALVKRRRELRKEKKWQEADEIRRELEKKGWMIKDTNIETWLNKK